MSVSECESESEREIDRERETQCMGIRVLARATSYRTIQTV